MGNSVVEDYGTVTVGSVVNLRIGVSSDPLTDGVARVLAIPLRELYAVLWRAGIVEIVDKPSSASEAA
jgi:hypothetical protein